MRTKTIRLSNGAISKALLAPILFLASFAHFDAAAQDFWQTTNGPYGGYIRCLAINANGHIFAGTRDEGVLVSTDNGESWKPINSGLANSTIGTVIVNSTGYAFAGTDRNGILRRLYHETLIS